MIYIVKQDNDSYEMEERFTKEIIVHNDMLLKKYYKARHLEGLSPYTLDSYMRYLRVLSRNVGKKFEEMNTSNIRDFLISYKEDRNLSDYSLDGIRLMFNAFFTFLEDEDYIKRSPMRKIKRIKAQANVRVPFTDEEMVKIRDVCKNSKERALIDFLYETGCRVSEVVSLDIDDIDFDSREIIVCGKGKKERLVFFGPNTKVHLEQYLQERKDGKSPLFVQDKFPNDRMSRFGVEFLVKDIGKRAGVYDCYPHKFRRTLATRLLEKGMAIEQVKEVLGHTSIETTLVYAKVNKNDVKNNHRKHLA